MDGTFLILNTGCHLKTQNLNDMTNVELIKELLTTVANHGVLPVYIDAGIIRDYTKGDDSIKDVVCQMGCVTLYNY